MNNNNDESEALDITELPTGEYPALAADDTLALNGADEMRPAVNGAAPEHENAEADRASFWLAHLEAEVTRLHAKWQGIDAEFKNREARAAALQQAIDAREATIDRLNADLQREAALLQAAEERLAGKDAELVALADDRRARDERIATLATELADADVAHKATLAKVEHAEAEIARLGELLRQEQAAAAAIAQQNEQLLAEQHRLQAKLQDLEIYINGRHDSWSELNAKLADYRDTVARMERTVEARDAETSRQDDEKRQLAAKILELERQCSELAGRRKEREEAYDELQRRLAGHFEQLEHRKTEHAQQLKELEQAAARALESQRHVAALEGDLKRRDETIALLNADITQAKAAAGELISSKSELARRADELDKDLAERDREMHLLRTELRTNREQLATLEAHATELGKSRADALGEVVQLKRELTTQRELVASLTAELRAKQAAADLLERSVGRITDLGASLAALDKEMQTGPSGTDGKASNPEKPAAAPAELLPMSFVLEDDAEHHASDRPAAASVAAGRKLVITMGGEAIHYPIVKDLMTIGRGHESDIRIASHFVSRVHAKISTSGAGTVIEDAGSKNGILVNSERVKSRVLHHGDVVNIGGELNLRFVDAMH